MTGRSPGPEAPLALDVCKVVLDRDPVEAGAEVEVEAGHPELGGDEELDGDLAEAGDDLLVVVGEVLRDGAVELAAELDGVVERVANPGPWGEERAGH